MHSSSASLLLLRHFEKPVLGATALWLVLVFAGFAHSPAAVNAEPAAAMGSIEVHMRTATPAPLALPDYAAIQRAWLFADSLSPGEPFPAWCAHQRPQFLYTTLPDPDALDCAHGPSAVESVDAAVRGEITVRWLPGRIGAHVRATYRLERRLADGPWKTLRDLDPNERTVVDRDVTPDRHYAYRVTSTAELDPENGVVIERREKDPSLAIPADARHAEGEPTECTTPVNVGFELNAVEFGDELRQTPSYAQIYVYRWSTRAGAFRRRLVRVAVGEAIGSGAFATGAVLTEVGAGPAKPARGRATEKATLRLASGATVTLDAGTPFAH